MAFFLPQTAEKFNDERTKNLTDFVLKVREVLGENQF